MLYIVTIYLLQARGDIPYKTPEKTAIVESIKYLPFLEPPDCTTIKYLITHKNLLQKIKSKELTSIITYIINSLQEKAIIDDLKPKMEELLKLFLTKIIENNNNKKSQFIIPPILLAQIIKISQSKGWEEICKDSKEWLNSANDRSLKCITNHKFKHGELLDKLESGLLDLSCVNFYNHFALALATKIDTLKEGVKKSSLARLENIIQKMKILLDYKCIDKDFYIKNIIPKLAASSKISCTIFENLNTKQNIDITIPNAEDKDTILDSLLINFANSKAEENKNLY